MYLNSSGTASGSYSLTFLGKKVGRNHSVAPAGKQIAWETPARSPEGPTVSSQARHDPVEVQMLENLPGSIQEIKEERTCSIVHSSQVDQREDSLPGVSGRKVTA